MVYTILPLFAEPQQPFTPFYQNKGNFKITTQCLDFVHSELLPNEAFPQK